MMAFGGNLLQTHETTRLCGCLLVYILCSLVIRVADCDETPEFLEQPQSQVISQSSPVTLKCSATPGDAHIRWLFDGQPLDQRRHPNLEIVGSNLHFSRAQLSGGDESNTGEYRCTATTTVGTIISQPAVLSKPELSLFSPNDNVVIVAPEGGYVTLTCDPPRSSPPALILFQTSAGEVVSVNTSTVHQPPSGNVVLSNISSASEGSYRCVAVNPLSLLNRTSPWTISVRVDRLLTNATQEAHIMPGIKRKVQVEIGSDITLECPSYGHRGANITWSKHGSSLPAGRFTLSDFGNLKIHTAQYEDSGPFICSTGANEKEQVHLEILTPSVVQVVKEPEMVAEAGTRVDMACTVAGFPKPELHWFHNGRELTNKDEGSLILASVSPADAGIYQCMATNKLGTAYGVIRLKVRGHDKGAFPLPDKLPTMLADDEDEGVSSGNGSLDYEKKQSGWSDRRKIGRQKIVGIPKKKKKSGPIGHADTEKPKYAPSVPFVSQLSDRSVMLNWSVPDKGNGQTIKFFKVQFKEMSPEKGPWRTSDAHLTYNIRRFEVSDLKSGGSYKFRILAVYEDDDNKNSANTPIFKLSIQPHTQAKSPDTAPTIVEAKPIVFQQNFGIGVKWQYKAETASPIEGFIIFYKPFGASEDKEKLIPGAGIRNDVIRDLLPNTPYNIRMQSFNSAGRSQFSNQVVKTTKARENSLEEDYPEPELPQKEPVENTEAPVSGRRSSETLEQPVILGVVLGALILALFILCAMCWWKQRQQKRRNLVGSPQQKLQDQSQCIFADVAHTKPKGSLYLANGSVPLANGYGPHADSHNHMNIDINPLAEYDMQTAVSGDGRQKQFYGNGINGSSMPRFNGDNSCNDMKFQHSGSTHNGDTPVLETQKLLYPMQHRTLPQAPSQLAHSFYSDTSSKSQQLNHEYSELGDRQQPSPGIPHSMSKQNIGYNSNNMNHVRNYDYNWSSTYDQPWLDNSHFSSGERVPPMFLPPTIDYTGHAGFCQQHSNKHLLPSLPKSSGPSQAPVPGFGTIPECTEPNHGSGKHKRRKKRTHARDPGPREHAVRDQATNTDLSSNEGTFDFATFCKTGSGSNCGSEGGSQNYDSSFGNNGSLESMNEDSHSVTSTVSRNSDGHFPANLPVSL
ncbi:hypothetical protein BsWGS_16700 [Bradybaena similaris]